MDRWSLFLVAVLAGCGGTSPSGEGPVTPGANDAGARGAADAASVLDDAATSRGDASGSRQDASASDAAAPAPNGIFWRQTAERGELAAFAQDATVVAADGALEIAPSGAHAGTDPYGAGGYHGKSFYNGGSYVYGVATSPVHVYSAPFTSVTPSFDVETPPGTWVHVKLLARVSGAWTKAYSLGVWAFDEGTVSRHSVDAQGDANGDVATDTLELTKHADALQIVVVLFSSSAGKTPRVRGLAAVAQDPSAAPPPDAPDPSRGTVLDVPKRSQMIYANGGEVWCSPTSTSMLLAYWAKALGKPELVETVPTAATRTYDFVYAGNGNWPFNTAHGAGMGSGALHGFVTRLYSFAQLERLIAARVPVAISVSYGVGELTGSPIASTDGHLIVAKGIAKNGDVVCNDPAFDADDAVEVTYRRDELERAWSHSNRTTYVLHPAGTPLPVDPLGGFY